MINDNGDQLVITSTQGFIISLPYCFLNSEVQGAVKSQWRRWGWFLLGIFRSFLIAAFLFIFFILCHLFVQRSLLRWRMVRTVGRKSTSLATNLTFNVSQKSGVQVTNTNTNANTNTNVLITIVCGESFKYNYLNKCKKNHMQV